MPELNLGPFSLEAPIGRGAMAEVWKGHHRERGVAVAVKVMTGSRTRFDHRVKSLFNEIRSVAQLDHPGIAWVLDYGTVRAEDLRPAADSLVDVIRIAAYARDVPDAIELAHAAQELGYEVFLNVMAVSTCTPFTTMAKR